MDNFTFNISLSVLNHLGRNLYRNFITVLGEAISNSWDADAKDVWITIDRDNGHLIIKDNGNGMTSDDFQNKFLKIGYSKRKEGIKTTILGRPFIGRKGIGKLALLSCAKRIHVVTKTIDTDWVGGIIDNRDLDDAIKDDLIPEEYELETLDRSNILEYGDDLEKGTIIYFEDLHDGIRNRVEYIRKLVALFFRFSLIDNSFKIHINGEPVTLNELNDLSLNTQFVWQINEIDDPYLKEKIAPSRDQIKEYKNITSYLQINGFIASVIKPSKLKIPNTDETVTVDLYVNGRLREKDILKHIPTTRIVESYLYGQIHFDDLDNGDDRFTSSREGVLSDDPLFKNLLEEIKNIIQAILSDWDKWRIKYRQDGDPENKRLTRKERKSKELFYTVVDEYIPPKTSTRRSLVDEWVSELGEDAQFNISSYTECFISENLVRKLIDHKKSPITKKGIGNIRDLKRKEKADKRKGNISINIRRNPTDLSFLSMDDLVESIDKVQDPNKDPGLPRDAKAYKPVRDAMAHTALLTPNAKSLLTVTFENIKARVKHLLNN
ncbi:MAG: ATP-binding protein [Tissierellia bacterium]|nr:ATP-binding protein [Tissierellia bacterium]